MNSVTNISLNVISVGTYECVSYTIKESSQEILCLEDGVITFYPIKGDKFTWNAESGKKIKLIPKKINIDSGKFLVFYNFYKNFCNPQEIEYSFLVDENNDNLVDENSDIFQIK